MRYILIILLFASLTSSAVSSPPLVLRACLNYDTDIVTLSWKSPSDQCGSFTKYSLYASEDNGPFVKLDDIPDISIQEYPHQLSVANTNWRYYVTILHLCDGTDSATSNQVLIDNTYPTTIEIDSLSYDLLTQNIIAGWSPNPSPDTKGFELYEYNFTTQSADSIGTTTSYTKNITELRAGNFPVVLSSYDSCNLSSTFSDPHRPVLLRGSIDTCSRTITLNWNKYTGWNSIDSQSLYVSRNGGPYIRDTTLSDIPNSFTYNKLVLGDTLRFYLRTYKTGDPFTSSSSTLTFETRKLVTPSYIYLSWVSVNDNINDNSTISLSWKSDNLQDINTFSIDRSMSGSVNTTIKSIATVQNQDEYTATDFLADADINIYNYTIVAVDKCDDTVSQSNTSPNMLLNILPTQTHSSYTGWENGVSSYELEYSTDRSTWNPQFSSTLPITMQNTETAGCYRVVAYENTNSLGYSSISYSNVQCRYDSLSFFVTTAISPNGINNKFVIKGVGIDQTKSTYEIYNRWGELIQQANISQPWFAEYKNTPVPSGMYIYIAKIYGILGEYKTQSGTVNVIR